MVSRVSHTCVTTSCVKLLGRKFTANLRLESRNSIFYPLLRGLKENPFFVIHIIKTEEIFILKSINVVDSSLLRVLAVDINDEF